MATQDDVYEATTRGIVDREHWWLMQAVTSDCLRLMKWGGMGSCWADVTVPAVLTDRKTEIGVPPLLKFERNGVGRLSAVGGGNGS